MTIKPDKAFILCAGMGTRLRPHTDHVPKPLVEVAGKSILERTIEKLRVEGLKTIVANTHYLAPKMEEFFSRVKDMEIILFHEETLLDSGGGIKNALRHFGQEPFFILNGDALWDDKMPTALSRLCTAWDDDKMDIILLLQPIDKMVTSSAGDYDVVENGRATRSKDKSGKYMFAGIRIAAPHIFDDTKKDIFSFLELMDKAEQCGRLFGVIHDAAWHHISTPKDLETVNALYKGR